MRRRSGAGGKPVKRPRLKTITVKKRVAPKAVGRRRSSAAGEETEIARLTRDLAQARKQLTEALEQQTATSEVLRVISSSPGELEPVFSAMLENATRICEAESGFLWITEGDGYRVVALHGAPSAVAAHLKMEPVIHPYPLSPLPRIAAARQVLQIADLAEDAAYKDGDPAVVNFVKLAEARTVLMVPLLQEGGFIGAMSLYRKKVQTFTDKQIALAKNFAAQAVIAIENTRLLSELRRRTDDLTEALTQQTATSEVLRVISSSPGNLQPVFKAILENATRICEAHFGTMSMLDGRELRSAAMHNVPSSFEELRQRDRVVPLVGSPAGKVLETKQVVQFTDVSTLEAYASAPLVKHTGARSIVSVPLLKESTPVGVITIYRTEVRPFSAKQIELVQNFAAQAVIAIENTRLLNELRQRTEDLTKSLEDLRTAQDRLVQTEKLASLGQLTAGIAHEIKNPLNFVNNFSGISVELIEELEDTLVSVKADEKTRAEIRELTGTLRGNLERVVQHGKRADTIVKNMLLHSREGSGALRPVDINALVEESS